MGSYCRFYFSRIGPADANRKALLPNEFACTKMCAFSLYIEEKLSQLEKRDRRIAEKRISDILFKTEMSADLSADGELKYRQRNTYSGLNFGIPQQGKQGSYNIQGQSYMDILSK